MLFKPTQKVRAQFVTAGILAAAATSQAALLQNGDFNTDTDLNNSPDGWSNWSYGNGWSNYVTSPADAFTKDGSSYINAGSTWDGGGGWYQTLAASAGQIYTLSVDSRTELWDNSNSSMRLLFLDNSGATLPDGDNNTPTAFYTTHDTWSAYTISDVVAPIGTTQVKVEFAAYGGTTTFDNANLTLIPEPASLGIAAMGATLLLRRRRQ